MTDAQLVSLALEQCRSTNPLPLPVNKEDPCRTIGAVPISCVKIALWGAAGGDCTQPFTDKYRGTDVCPVACQQCVPTCVNPYQLTVTYLRPLSDDEVAALRSTIFELGKADGLFVDQDRAALVAAPVRERYCRPRSARPVSLLG
jgi:hypothetical protein